MVTTSNSRRGGGVAFLLAQVGQVATDQFAQRLGVLQLTPAQAGILRAIAAEPGRSQQALSAQLALLPSRVVAFVDDLERQGYVERRRNPTDRRLHALHLTESGAALMTELAAVARAHEQAMTAGLTAAQKSLLRGLLADIAERQGLTPGVHPGYRSAPES